MANFMAIRHQLPKRLRSVLTVAGAVDKCFTAFRSARKLRTWDQGETLGGRCRPKGEVEDGEGFARGVGLAGGDGAGELHAVKGTKAVHGTQTGGLIEDLIADRYRSEPGRC